VELLLAEAQTGDRGTASARVWAYLLGALVATLAGVAIFRPGIRRRFLSAVRRHIWAYTFLLPDFVQESLLKRSSTSPRATAMASGAVLRPSKANCICRAIRSSIFCHSG